MTQERPYQICSRCVMDTTDPDIVFDAQGVCNHCEHYRVVAAERLFHGEDAQRRLDAMVKRIKREGEGRSYDCIIGVSGGVDSTYVAYLVKQLGLRPLAVHFDNGWNNELAVANIEKVLKKLDIDLYTCVVDWPEFRDLQLAFLKASTPDSEVPTDHAIVALLYQVAAREGVRHIILGTNLISEAVMPIKWGYGYSDLRYIKALARRFGARPFKTFPHFGLTDLFTYTMVRGIRLVSILNYVKYDRAQVMEILQKELGWIYYGGKHYESIYTRFFQAYILPRKFNIDKRRAHYSNLICSGQLSRERALEQLKQPTYPPDKLELDREYAVKKFGISEAEFAGIMALPPKTFLDYPSQYGLTQKLKKLKWLKSFIKI